jgi:RNA polymerase sigma-70 factor, ECF subfamily
VKQQIKRALQDTAHMTEFLRELEPFVYRVCYHLTCDQPMAESLAERSLLAICRELHTFDGESALQSWVYRIILRIQEDMTLRERTSAATPPGVLSGLDRQIYVMRFVLDLPLQEIAALLRMKESTVKSRFMQLREGIATHYTSGGEAV